MNEREKLRDSYSLAAWIAGFVDGEGTFSVSIFRNRKTSIGWQALPEFLVTQGQKSIGTLELMRDYFNCGNIYVNRLRDDHHESAARYCVRRFRELDRIIVPFFKIHPLRTAKSSDFESFRAIIDLMKNREHLTLEGLERIAAIGETMNSKKPSEFLFTMCK